jgi:hypothetical protein
MHCALEMTSPATPLRILITNNTAGGRAGSELYVRDLALGLIRRGHQPVVYSTVLGEVAEQLHRATVPVVDDLDALGFVPDLIHGQHHVETMTAVLRFPQVPAVYFCHGWLPWEEMPPVHPSIRRYVAVDDLCAERLLTTAGIEATCVETIYNGVDLERFKVRSPLPDRPRSALIFSNYAEAGGYGDIIRSACKSFGIEHVEIVGSSSGNSSDCPEELLPQYDIVFGKARCALEAMAAGCATVVADRSGLAGMVSMANVEQYRRLNFGVRTLQGQAISNAAVLEQLRNYDAKEAKRVSAWIRGDAAFSDVVDRVLEVYEQVLATPLAAISDEYAAAAARYLRALSPRLKSVLDAERQASVAERQASVAEQRLAADGIASEIELQRLHAESARLGEALRLSQEQNAELGVRLASGNDEVVRLREEAARLGEQLRAMREQQAIVDGQLGAIHNSKSWRALTIYRRFRSWLA